MPGKKRKNKTGHYREPESSPPGAETSPMGVSASLLPPLPAIGISKFTLTTTISTSTSTIQNDSGPTTTEEDAGENKEEWQKVKRHKKSKKEKSVKNKNYPEFVVSPQKLKRHIQLSDLQGLALWLVADGAAPQWLLVRHKPEIRRLVVVMAPGLTKDMFDGTLDFGDSSDAVGNSPVDVNDQEDYFPSSLDRRKLPECLQDMAGIFPYLWPVRAPGDDRYGKIHSPIASFLTSPLPKNSDPARTGGTSQRMKIRELRMTLDDLIENEYVLHTSQLEERRRLLNLEETDEDRANMEKRKLEGWVETDISRGNDADKNEAGAVTEGKTLYSIDCEMCMTEDGFELTRISVVGWDGNVVYDTLVKPLKPITDYVTAYSGITAELLAPITTTLQDVQAHILTLLNNDTVLIGQSLNSDLNSLRLAHPHIIDTSVIYHHTRGPPYKASLKWLTQRFLKREIQSTGGLVEGHDSIEDARACLDLVKLKLEKGPAFGTSDEMRESIFKRFSRPAHSPKKTAMLDTGDPGKFYGANATNPISCNDDAAVVRNIALCASGSQEHGLPQMDFVWARLRSLELARGFATPKADGRIDIDGPPPALVVDPLRPQLAEAVSKLVKDISAIYNSLPKCTAFVVYTGTGDPRRWRQLEEMHRRFKEEYKTKKWDELSVKWTDVEEQLMREELKRARDACAFMVVK